MHLPPNTGQTTHPSASTSLLSISWPAGTAIAERKQRSLSKVDSFLSAVVSLLAHPQDQCHDRRLPRIFQGKKKKKYMHLYVLTHSTLNHGTYVLKVSLINSSCYAQSGGLKIVSYFFNGVMLLLVTSVVIVICFGQKRLLNALNGNVSYHNRQPKDMHFILE